MKKTINQKKGDSMTKKNKKLNIVDFIVLATYAPALFKCKEQLAFILKAEKKIVEDMFNQYKKEVA